MTAAHTQVITLNTRLREWVPEHEPREHDPEYHLFHAAKRLLRAHDIHCWRCDVSYADLVKRGAPATPSNPYGAYQLEAHHADLEFSLLNGVDVEKWWNASHPSGKEAGLVEAFSNVDGWLAAHPEYHATFSAAVPIGTVRAWHTKVFKAYMESEGNLMQLCDVCHRSKDNGIHHIPYPDWRATRTVWRDGLPDHVAHGAASS